MKKLQLRKSPDPSSVRRIGYKINYERELNQAQYDAVMHNFGAALVIAGAGTGKTRTLVYRVARLIEDSVPPSSILLLTFTRKASAEMLRRASALLDGRCEKVAGGTFHSFAMQTLRIYANTIGFDQSFTVLDQSDSEDTINLIRTQMKFDKTGKRFPQKKTLQTIHSLSVNKKISLEEVINSDFPQFIDDSEQIANIMNEYGQYKKRYNLMDYDDLLNHLLELLKKEEKIASAINTKYQWLMVDEYQDTNRLQHEIVLQLAGGRQNVMAVGDDAQSIYSFRGANFQNIMFFPESFGNCSIYRIEENYRSTQPILNLTNTIIADAIYKYEKKLFTRITGGELPKIIAAKNEAQQSRFLVQEILELREQGIQLDEMAVLFRFGFLSFDLEIELNKSNIPFMKFGGMKFIETAHIKDMLAYFKIIINPKDAVSWQRTLLLLDGIGPRTASKLIDRLTESKSFGIETRSAEKSMTNVKELLNILTELKESKIPLSEKAAILGEYYKTLLKNKYEDWQRRWRDIESLIAITQRYRSIREFINELTIEPTSETLSELHPESKEDEYLTLSTIHSAKGLEWRSVFLIWALEGRFPPAKSIESLDTLEEERRLFYVACTRAKKSLYITYPFNIFDNFSGTVLSEPSRFLANITDEISDKYVLAEDDDNEGSE